MSPQCACNCWVIHRNDSGTALSGFTGIVCFVCLTLDKELKQSVSQHSLSWVCRKTCLLFESSSDGFNEQASERRKWPVLKIGCKRLLNNSLAVQKPNFILASHGKSQGLESFSSSATLTFETPAGGLYCLEVFYINFDGNVEKTSIFITLKLHIWSFKC